MPLLLHAIGPTDGQAEATPDSGLRPGWPLRAVCACGLMAWASECLDVPSFGRDDVLAHHRLAQRGLAAGLCLPVRFPTWVTDERALQDLLKRRQAALLTALERVRGRVELAVTVTWTAAPGAHPPSVVASSPGKRYLEQRRQHYAETDQRRGEAERLGRVIEADARVVEARHSVTHLGLSSALLVGADDALAVTKRLEGLCEGVRILVNGPWPPYSFVSLEG